MWKSVVGSSSEEGASEKVHVHPYDTVHGTYVFIACLSGTNDTYFRPNREIAPTSTAQRFLLAHVQTIIVARTDAEAASLLDNNVDPRDHPFILGATVPGTRSEALSQRDLG